MYNDMTLEQLKAQRGAVKKRLELAKKNTPDKRHGTSPAILSLVRDDERLLYLIENYIPHDITPNPGGHGGGVSSPALLHA